MKTLGILLVGIVVGAAGSMVVQYPKRTGEAIHGGLTAVDTKVKKLTREQCVKEFLEQTHCYQNKPDRTCDTLIVGRCGVPE